MPHWIVLDLTVVKFVIFNVERSHILLYVYDDIIAEWQASANEARLMIASHSRFIYAIYVCTLHKQVLQLCKLDCCTLCRCKAAVRQSCLAAALPIVLLALCLLSCFLANNGNGRLDCP